MDKKALYNLSYGVFMLATRSGNVVNGCITNTCIQVANNPVRIAISVLNSNYTCDLIKESGIFTLSLLDQTCSFETIRHFGFSLAEMLINLQISLHRKMKMQFLTSDGRHVPFSAQESSPDRILEHTLFLLLK